MREHDIKHQILQAAYHDTPDLKDSIKADPRFRLPNRMSFFKRLQMRPIQLASSLLVLFIAGFLLFSSLNNMSTTVYATVYIDINPSVEIDLDEDYRVIEIRGMNEDAEELIQGLSRSKGQHLDSILDKIIEESIKLDYLNQDRPTLMIDVVSQSNTIREQIINTIETMIPQIARDRLENMELLPGNAGNQTTEEVERAHANQMSVMKLRLIENILELDDSYSFEDLADLDIHELRLIFLDDNTGGIPGWVQPGPRSPNR